MRPEILNPLFAEVEALKGVGPGLRKPLARLGLARAVDLLFHLPSGWIERKQVARLDQADVGRVITIALTAVDYRAAASSRGPFRVEATDSGGDHVSLVYFGANAGWARKLFPLGEMRLVSGKLDAYGQQLQIVHPDLVLAPGEALPAAVEPVYPLSEGLTSRRLGQLIEQALSRAPELDEWIEPSLLRERGWPAWRAALTAVHADAGAAAARVRLAYDEIFANQLALILVRASARRRRGRALAGDGRLRGALRLPYRPTGAQLRAVAEIEGDLQQDAPMLRLLQGDVGSGKTLVALMALLIAVESGAQGALLAPTEILASTTPRSAGCLQVSRSTSRS